MRSRTWRRLGAVFSSVALVLTVLPAAAPAATGDPVLINEVLASTTGTDVEFVEFYGIPGASLDGLSFIVVEGNDSAGPGAIDARIDFTADHAIGSNGYFLAGNSATLQSVYGVTPNLDFATNTIENSSATYALVETSSISGTVVTGSEVALDTVALTDATASTFFFGAPVVGPDGTFFPAGARRVAEGIDTDVAGDWVISDFTLGSANTPTAGTVEVDIEITEIHYDNTDTDVGEAIEVSGPEGFDMTGWSIVLYNGNGGAVYGTTTLAGVIPAGGAFSVSYPTNGIQNGSPDGIALVDAAGVLVEFLSYEGTFTGVGGAADGVLSTDIGVFEPFDTPVGQSLQKVAGVWQAPAPSTFAPPLTPAGPDCSVGTVLISLVQGDGAVTPCDGQQVTVEGIVVGDYEGPGPALRGFYVQEEAADFDGDESTSEALFVFNGNDDSVNLGDLVEVTGTAGEFQDQTQISFVSSINVVSLGNAVEPVEVELPFSSEDYLERFEGMLVETPQTLYVTEYFQLGRFGEVVVSSGDRLRQPTDIAEPGAPANAVQAANNLNRLKIDDALNIQNPDPIIFSLDGSPLTESNAFRGGDTITGAVGIMTYTWAGNSASPNAYRLRPVNALGATWDFESQNARPSGPPEVGGTATVAAFNVLNYYTTIDAGPDGCGPALDQDCRGADSALELERQRVKLLEALDRLDAEVVGLVELENTTGVEAMADIVAGLNSIPGGPEYDYVETGTIGTDAIKVGVIYQAEAVTPQGDYAILDSSVDARFDDDRNRPALAQSFISDDGEVFTVVVNHFKSKGCGDAVGAEADQGDGQGCWNPTRTAAAEALVDWLASDPTGSGDPDVFVTGDLNSYAMEDPIDVLVDAGYVDLGRAFEGDDHYTYVFNGQWGYLDYALASASVVTRVTGAGSYHINADEIPVLDYNTDFKSLDQITSLFAPNEFRTSDHDPVILGFCDAVAPTATATATPSMLWPPNNKMVNVAVTLDVFDASGADVELVSVTSNEPDWNPKRGPDIVIVDDTTFQLRASRLDEGSGRVYTISYSAVDACGNETEFSTEVTVPIALGDD